MSRIFISYRRDDSAAEAGRIYDYLENKFGRESIFMDVDAIDAGDDFRERINEAVGQCQILLAVIGKNWLHCKDAAGRRRLENPADWVRLEIEAALDRKIRVIPILLDGVEMPAISDLPVALQPLAYRNAARVRHNPDFKRDIRRVLEVIERNLASLSASTEPLPVPPASTLTPEELYNRGLEKYNAKDYQGAITDYDSALRLDPDYAVTYNNRGVAKSALGNKQGAIADYDSALRLNPNHATAYFNRGNAKHILRDEQGAIADYNSALRLNPDCAKAYFNRGTTKSALGNKQEAIADYDSALRLNPDYADVYGNRGTAKYVLGDKQGAIADYDSALRINPDHSVVYYNRGATKSDLGDKQGAISDFRDAAELYAQQGNTEWYSNALTQIKQLS